MNTSPTLLVVTLMVGLAAACGDKRPALVTSGANPDTVNTPATAEPEPDCCCVVADGSRNAVTQQACTRVQGTCEADLQACYAMSTDDTFH